MTTLQSFNSLLGTFLQELSDTFPEDANLAVSADGLSSLVKVNARKPLHLFMEAMSPHAQLVMTKDDALFAQPVSLVAGLDLKTLWDSPDLSDASKDAIWQYIQSLFLLGSTVSALPPEMLGAIESMAQDCASKIESGETSLESMTSMLLGGGGGAGLSSLFGSLLSSDAATPSSLLCSANQSKKNKK